MTDKPTAMNGRLARYYQGNPEGLENLLNTMNKTGDELTARIAALEAEIADHDKMYPIIKKQLDDTAAENAKLRDLLTRTHKTYENMTTDAFSKGADRHIRAEVEKFLGLEPK